MPLRPQRRYGDTGLYGNARAQFGDRQVTKNINIKEAYVLLADQLDLPDIESLEQHLLPGHLRTPSVRIPPRQRLKERRRSQPCTEDVEACERNGFSEDGANNNSGDRKSTTRALPSRADFSGLKSLSLQRWFTTGSPPSYPNGLSSSQQTYTVAPPAEFAPPIISDTSFAATATPGTFVGHDLPLLFTCIASYIFGQNVSVEDVCRFLLKCQQNQLLGLLTCVLGVGLWKHLLLTRPLLPSTSSGQILLEDAYGRVRPISIDVCMDFEVMTKFLQFHYRESNGETARILVAAGKSHLTMKSRYGKSLRRGYWTTYVFAPGQKIVNSVYVSHDEPQCLVCQAVMISTKVGYFYCHECKRYYRDCIKLMGSKTYSQSTVQRPTQNTESILPRPPTDMSSCEGGLTVAPRPHRPERETHDRDTTIQAKYNVEGLVNLDIWIERTSTQSPSPAKFQEHDRNASTNRDPDPIRRPSTAHIASETHSIGSRGKHGFIEPEIVLVARSGDCETVRRLINAGADVNGEGPMGTPLFVASNYGHEDVVSILLDAGADPNFSKWQDSVLSIASRHGHATIVRMLLDAGADPNLEGPADAALYHAAWKGRVRTTQILLDAGADVDRMSLGGTALQAATRNNYEHVVRLLLDSGADIDIVGSSGTALQIAATRGHVGIIRLLLHAGTGVDRAIEYTAAWRLSNTYGNHETSTLLQLWTLCSTKIED